MPCTSTYIPPSCLPSSLLTPSLGATAGLVLVLDRGLKIMSRMWCLFECHAACCHRSSAHVTVAFPEQMAIADVLRCGDGWEVYMRTPGLSAGVHFPEQLAIVNAHRHFPEQLAIVNAHRYFPPLMRPGWRSCVLASTRSPFLRLEELCAGLDQVTRPPTHLRLTALTPSFPSSPLIALSQAGGAVCWPRCIAHDQGDRLQPA